MRQMEIEQSALLDKTSSRQLFQSRMAALSANFKTIKTLLVEGIFKKETKFTKEELEEAEQACIRG